MSAAALRKGWCPGALRPMAARDGLLVRLRITAGIVPAAIARAIAGLAERHGNGLLDLSARANLQMRGVHDAALPALLDDLAALDLLDDDPGGEAVRNVLCSPQAGLAPDAPDIRPLAAALEAALVGDPACRALPPKFGFLLDDGSRPGLADVAADVRFAWRDGAFDLGLGGTATTALPLGRVAEEAVVPAAAAVARRLLVLPGGPRRTRALLHDLGRDAVAAAFAGLAMPGSAAGPTSGIVVPSGRAACGRDQRVAGRAAPPRNETGGGSDVVGVRAFGAVTVLGLAVPFGRLDAAMLRAAADAAGGRELRLTPWRAILIPEPDPATDLPALAARGFVTDPADPRLRVAACTGRTGCERGTTDTHADAAALAPFAAALPGGVSLHVSGCAKGCARPRRTAVTLVGRDGRYDLLRDGRPGDTPALCGLDLAAVRAVLAAA